MPQHKHPKGLAEQTLLALESYIHKLACRLFRGFPPYDVHLLQEFLYGDLPPVLAGKVSHSVLSGISTALTELERSTRCFELEPRERFEGAMEALVDLAVNPSALVFDMRPWQLWIQELLFKGLAKMTELRVLHLCIQFPGFLKEEQIILGLSNMCNLVSVSMEDCCSDDVLRVLAESCPSLMFLSVTRCEDVTDAGVESLLQLRKLQQLTLMYTSMHTEGHVRLMTGGLDLHQLELSALKHCHVNSTLLANSWPQLSHLHLVNVQDDLSGLAALEKLKDLTVCSCSFVSSNLGRVLDAMGSQLLALKLMNVEDVDVVTIGKCCTRLRSLSLHTCSLEDVTSSSLESLLYPFAELESLTLHGNRNLCYFPLLLRFCALGLRRLDLNGVITETLAHFAEEILMTGKALRNLEELHVGWNLCLTMHTVRLLLNHCPHLSLLVGLGCCKAISSSELNAFKEEVRRENLNLVLLK